MRISEFKTPPYCETIKVVVCKDFTKAFKKMKVSHSVDVNQYEAITTIPIGKKMVLFIRKDAKASVVAHEAVHIANIIFKRADIQLDIDNDEPYAYLLGWIVDCITTIINKKKRKLNK